MCVIQLTDDDLQVTENRRCSSVKQKRTESVREGALMLQEEVMTSFGEHCCVQHNAQLCRFNHQSMY